LQTDSVAITCFVKGKQRIGVVSLVQRLEKLGLNKVSTIEGIQFVETPGS
jgi:hypothetical protein